MRLNASLLEGAHLLGIALSGGSDSTALLILAAEHCGAAQLRAVTVDHGLRPEAATEARTAAKLCRSLGVPHEVLALEMKGGSDVQARARRARYAALSDWARKAGVGAIALGHTQDDLAEGFLIRLARGSGVDGLAAMQARFEHEGVQYLRPLLDCARRDLRAYLEQKGISWSDDPSNEDDRFTRVRMRKAMPALSELGLTRDRLAQTARWMSAASEVLEQAADRFIDTHARADHGDAVFDLDALQKAAEETALRVLARALCAISGNPYRPRLDALKTLRASEAPTTLHGCLAYRHKGTLRLTQELNAARKAPSRWRMIGSITAQMRIAPLGETGLTLCTTWRETALVPRRSLLASPAIWEGEALIAAPLAAPDVRWRAVAPNPLLLAPKLKP